MQLSRLKLLFLFTISILTLSVFAQEKGKIAGKIIDKKTGEELIGVSIQIEGTSIGAATDYEGKFIINNLAPGSYNLVLSYISYKKKVVTGVEVKSKETTIVNTTLEESTKELNEVVIRGEVKKESANAVLIQQKNAIAVSSGVSADLIRKTPDRTTADVIKRVSGASIQDNKFAIVRGLGDRYNMGFLNGAPLPSSESDRKAFSLDIIPAAVLDNMMITKTATPDMPGDFAGGFIQINTKDIPDEDQTNVQLSMGMHSLTTFRETQNFGGGSQDFLGVDDGSRGVSANIPSTEQMKAEANAGENDKLAGYMRESNNNFNPTIVNSTRPNINFQASTSKRFKSEHNDFGLIAALTYNNNLRYLPFTITNLQGINTATEVSADKYDGQTLNYNTYKNTVMVGGLANFSFKLGKYNKFYFKNLITQIGEDQSTLRTGRRITGINDAVENQIESQYNHYISQYQQSRMLSSQLGGEHLLPGSKVKIQYVFGFNNIEREMPDFRRLFYQADRNFSPDMGKSQAQILDNASGFSVANSGRFTSKLSEKSYSANYNVTVPVKLFKKTDIKLGGMHFVRDRTFNARNFLYSFNSGNPNWTESKKEVPVDGIFNDSNVNAGGFFQKDATQPFDSYTASSALHAGYLMLDQKVLSRVRVIYGVRFENFNQKLNSFDNSGSPVVVNTTVLDILPSANLIYELTEKQNLRLGYAKTVSRPEFREFAPLAFFEVNYNGIITGNRNLTRAKIDNFDFKWELYPSAGQTISINPFYKRFINPVEMTVNPQQDNFGFSYANAASAENYGVEFEVRLSLAYLDKLMKTDFMKNITVFSNYALIRSNVEIGTIAGGAVTSRPLQGQSPYVFNAGINYNNPKFLDFSFNVNRIGRRIAFVGTQDAFIIWENPRTVLDASISKTFFKKLTAKITMGDILAQRLIYYQDLNKNGQYDNGKDIATFNYRNGYTTAISLSYNF